MFTTALFLYLMVYLTIVTLIRTQDCAFLPLVVPFSGRLYSDFKRISFKIIYFTFKLISAVLLCQFERLSTRCEMTIRRLTPTYWIKKCSLVTSRGYILYYILYIAL